MADAVGWIAAQIVGRDLPPDRVQFNPRPPGVVRPGSGTDAVVRLLRQHPRRWFFRAELNLLLGRSRGEVDWAVIYLARMGRITEQACDIPGRKPVMRYRLREE